MFGFGFMFLAGPNLNWGPGSTLWVNLNLRSEPEPQGSMPNRRYLPTHQSMDDSHDNLPPAAPQTLSNLHCNTNDTSTPLSTIEHLVLIDFLGGVGALCPHMRLTSCSPAHPLAVVPQPCVRPLGPHLPFYVCSCSS